MILLKYIRKNGIKDPGSAITHGIALILAVAGALPLILKAAGAHGYLPVIAMSIFMLSMILLYMASTIYHTFDVSQKVNRRLKKFDHMMISVLIAGSYTPICLLVLNGTTGTVLCILVWAAALAGILIKAFWINCPKWVSSVLYIGMGWMCVMAFKPLFDELSRPAFGWLLAGGIIYTIGGVIYSLKLPAFNARHKKFGTHEIFHLFVMGGSICHFIVMYFFVAAMAV